MVFSEVSCREFVDVLGSKAPVPGGGGASALVGAVGCALGNMVGSLTVGKKKYKDVEADMYGLIERAENLQRDLLGLIQRDAEAFEPLSKVYAMKHDTKEQKQEKAEAMEKALREACTVPVKIMEKTCETIELLGQFASKGSVMAISDAGAGAACCQGALKAASLNVYINTKSMQDRSYAEQLNKNCDQMIEKYTKIAGDIFDDVLLRLK